VLLRALGVLLLALVAVDVFRTVLLPSARGLSDRLWVAVLWRLATLLPGRGARAAAGPLALALTIAGWLVLLWLAFALLYLPDVDRLGYSSDVRFEGSGLVAALYLSGTVLTTLGLGDVAAQTDGLRLLVVLQSGCGLAVFTAALGYLPAVYTVISDLRASAESVSDLRVDSPQRAVELLDENPVMTLEAVRRDVITARQVLLRFPLLHWFHPPAGQSVLAVVEGATLLWLAARLGFSAERHPAVQRHAQSLELALRRLVGDAATHVGGSASDEGRQRGRELVEQVRSAVRDLEPERAADAAPPEEAIEDLARAHGVMRRYAQVHDYPAPQAF
jgi:hypothetical protein